MPLERPHWAVSLPRVCRLRFKISTTSHSPSRGPHRLLRCLPSLVNQLGDALSKKRLPFGWLHLLPCWRVAGGALCQRFESSMQGSRACVVYLHAGVDALVARRERQDQDRPALFGAGGLREEVVRTYAERDPVFRDLARHIVEVDGQESKDSLTLLMTIFKEECLGEGPTM